MSLVPGLGVIMLKRRTWFYFLCCPRHIRVDGRERSDGDVVVVVCVELLALIYAIHCVWEDRLSFWTVRGDHCHCCE
jgi:hypothetical protein